MARVLAVPGRDEERHACVELEVRSLAPKRVLADVIAVIRDEHDGCPVRDSTVVQRIEHLSELGVHERDVGEVAVPHFRNLLR